MLIDLLSMDNYVSYNIKVASLLGLHQAIYLSELMNINEKAVRKSKTNNNFFTVDRKYITQRTTLSREEQLSIDKFFLDIGLLKVDESCNNTMTLDIAVLTTLLSGDNESIVSDLKQMQKSTKKLNSNSKLTKEQQQCELMKTYIETTNPELYAAYCDWIDSVYAKIHWMSKKAVQLGQKLVDETSNRDLDIALKIVEIASVNGWKDMTWAVKTYKENYEPTYRIKSVKQEEVQRSETSLSEEVF